MASESQEGPRRQTMDRGFSSSGNRSRGSSGVSGDDYPGNLRSGDQSAARRRAGGHGRDVDRRGGRAGGRGGGHGGRWGDREQRGGATAKPWEPTPPLGPRQQQHRGSRDFDGDFDDRPWADGHKGDSRRGSVGGGTRRHGGRGRAQTDRRRSSRDRGSVDSYGWAGEQASSGGTRRAGPDIGFSYEADDNPGSGRAGGDERDESATASTWMRGELSEFQDELSPHRTPDDDSNFDMLYGIAPVLNALRNNRREKLGLYCQDGVMPGNKKDRAAANTIYDLARVSDVTTITSDKGYLNSLCSNRPHQGFILKARPLEFEPILFLARSEDASEASPRAESVVEEEAAAGTDESVAKTAGDPLVAAPGRVWLALDEVTDPQNFGALLRSAHFFGASGVVTCAKNSASLTPTVSKSSAGAVEVMRIHSAANMMRFLKRSRENGWRIVGTAISESSVPLHELQGGPLAPPTIVVLGNEGYGVRTNVLRECEVLVEITGEGGGALAEGTADSTVDSLNVSVTGGVMLFHLLGVGKHAG